MTEQMTWRPLSADAKDDSKGRATPEQVRAFIKLLLPKQDEPKKEKKGKQE